MKIVNIEMIRDFYFSYEYGGIRYFPVMVTYKRWFSRKLVHERYNPTWMKYYNDTTKFLCYVDEFGKECGFNKSLRFCLFMQSIHYSVQKTLGPDSPVCQTEGNRYFGCTADIERKGWINGKY